MRRTSSAIALLSPAALLAAASIGAALVGAASVAAGCARCGSDGAVAELTAASGSVEADDASEPVDFAEAAVGRRFGIGDAIRTGVDATADLALAGGGALHVDPVSVVRFARTAGASRVEVESGSTTLEAPDEPIEVETVFGVAHLAAHTRTRIGPGDSRFEVVVGHATIEREGESLVVEMGHAVDTLGHEASRPPITAPPRELEADPSRVAATRAIDVRGTGAHIRAVGVSSYVPLAEGPSEVPEGSILRADVGTTIEIATPDGHVRMAGDAEVELARTGARASHGRFDVAGGGATRLEVPGGTIVLADGLRVSSAYVEVTRGGAGTVTVRSGEVVHETAQGAHTLHADDTIALGEGGAVVEAHDVATAPVDPADPGAGPIAEDTPTTPPPTGTVAAVPTTPAAPSTLAPVTLSAGESVVVHDPDAPTLVRVEAPSACERPVWRVDHRIASSASADDPALVASLRAGTHRYQLRCADGPARRGSVRVDRDRGQTPMPRTAPRTVVDADGRPYSVLYQTLLPEIVLRWPHTSSPGPYEIEVQRGSATRRVRSPTASYTFASGELAEGITVLAFRAADGSRSPPTTVNIHFDNATPVASVRSPAVGAALSGTAHVEGAVAPGATVSVAGHSVEVDRSARFSGDVPVPPGGCISIRVALAGRGVHHYVRCGR